METVEKIWFNGKMMPWDDVKVHVLTHALHYGSGVFEGIRFYNTDSTPAVFRLKEHIDRLFYSAEKLEMEVGYTPDEVSNAILDVIRENKTESGYIRPLIFYGYGKMGLYPHGAPVHTCIAIWPWGSYLGKDMVRVKISPFKRFHPETVIPDAKVCGYYVNSIFASLDAHKDGFDEALMLDCNGNIAEGPGENLFVIKNNTLYTVATGSILPGITRNSVMQIAKDEGINVEEKVLTLDDILGADELFFTGTAAEVQPISHIDDTEISKEPGPISTKIQKIYLDAVRGKVDKYRHWLSFT